MLPSLAASKPTKTEAWCRGSTRIVAHRGVDAAPGKSERPDPRRVVATLEVRSGVEVGPIESTGPVELHQAISDDVGTGLIEEGPAQLDESEVSRPSDAQVLSDVSVRILGERATLKPSDLEIRLDENGA
jgi:hypothetical protein